MSTALAKKPLRQVKNVKELLYNDQARDQLASVAANVISPERMMRVVNNAIRTTPKLQECDPLSFLGALMQCASLGLEPQTVLGHAYLIPFKNNRKNITEVQVVIGYKGLIDLARRSGHITSISANIHYADDELWDWEEGTEARLRHRPGPQNGDKLHAYAVAQFKDGGHAYIVLPWAKVMKTRDGSQGWQTAVRYNKTQNSPWHTHEDAMAMKTAIRALSKYLPLSVEFMDAVQIDNDSGARVDFAAMAMNPEEGPVIEGDVIDGETGEILDDDKQDDKKPASEKSKAKPKPKPEAKKAKPAAEKKPAPKPVEDEKQEDQGPDPETDDQDQPDAPDEDETVGDVPDIGEAQQKLVDLIADELADTETADDVNGVLEMWADQIAPLEGTKAGEEITKLAEARKAELSD